MPNRDDTAYYFQRAETELARERAATTREARVVHRELAQRYLARCSGLASTPVSI